MSKFIEGSRYHISERGHVNDGQTAIMIPFTSKHTRLQLNLLARSPRVVPLQIIMCLPPWLSSGGELPWLELAELRLIFIACFDCCDFQPDKRRCYRLHIKIHVVILLSPQLPEWERSWNVIKLSTQFSLYHQHVAYVLQLQIVRQAVVCRAQGIQSA